MFRTIFVTAFIFQSRSHQNKIEFANRSAAKIHAVKSTTRIAICTFSACIELWLSWLFHGKFLKNKRSHRVELKILKNACLAVIFFLYCCINLCIRDLFPIFAAKIKNRMPDLSTWGLFGLFLASFLAATVVPFSSEALLTVMIARQFPVGDCILVATAGNWLGGMSSFGLGYLGRWEWIEKYLHVSRQSIEKWHNRMYNRGAVFAFLCWVPFVGDVFAVGLGFLRTNGWIVALFMLLGKASRYVVWAWLSGFFV